MDPARLMPSSPTPPAAASNPPHAPAPVKRRTPRLGCVSYLNSKPLIHGIESLGTPVGACPPPVRFDVPANLLRDLESGEVDLALCPVIDYHRAATPLQLVPVGGIGSEHATLTVRLYSRVPVKHITTIHADTDSHTSVALVQVLLHALHGLRPRIIDYHARKQVADGRLIDQPEAMLLIGDKVVTDSPRAVTYPYQLDLGEAWHGLTGLPFVFAIWMARRGAELGALPEQLVALREANMARIDELAALYASRHGWPLDLASDYLRRVLHYAVGERELEAMALFARKAAALGLIDYARPLDVWGRPS